MSTIDESPRRKRRPVTTPEAKERQLVNLAVDLAERQLLDGTASSQVITHFLKMSSSREALEQRKLEKETELLAARTEALEAEKRIEVLYEEAIEAMRSYTPKG